MNRSTRLALAIFLALAQALLASPRTPHGIYAVVNVKEYLNVYQKTHSTAAPSDYFGTTVFPGLLANPDVSGIALYQTWAMIQQYPVPRGYSPYDWTIIQALFDQVAKWNSDNPTKPPKTIQLGVTPGFNAPTWLLDQIYSCNYLFSTAYAPPPAGTTCGKATFWGFTEGGYDKTTGIASPRDLPMPWDSTYKRAWQTFLTALATQYGSRTELVSIAVAGPTASSEEMILPATRNTNGAAQIGGFTPEQMWNKLLANHYTSAYKDYTKYQKTDVALIDEWEHAIDMFGKTFNGITLTMSTGDGLPNLTGAFTFPTDPTTNFATVCPDADMDCAAETTILAYFNQSTVGGPNAKATMTDGMKGAGTKANLGVPNVKLISESTDLFTSPSQRILGGAQFAHRFSTDKSDEGNADEGGCPSTCSAEQAEYNVLVWFFDGTSEGPSFPTGTVPMIGGNTGSAPLNYLQIYGPDITYASTGPTTSVQMGTSTPMVSAQDLLHMASLALTMIAEK